MARSAYGLDTGPDTNWRINAACGPDTAELFFVTGHVGRSGMSKDNKAALALCDACPVKSACYLDARDHPAEGWRIAGGQVWRPATRADVRDGAVSRRLAELSEGRSG